MFEKQFDDAVLVAAYMKHKSQTKAAEEVGCSRETVARAVRRAGIPLTGRKNNGYHEGNHKGNYGGGSPLKITDGQILAGIKEGLTRQQIADKYGVHVENLARRMHRLGVHAKYSQHQGFAHIYGDCWHYVSSQDEKCKQKFTEFEYLESRMKKRGCGRIRMRCKKCGSIIERSNTCLRNSISIKCDRCEDEKKTLEARADMVRFFIALKSYKTPKRCVVCGEEFYSPYETKRYCSDRCKQKGKSKSKGHTGDYRHRARKYGCEYEPGITLKKVYERDHGICQICGLAVDWSDNTWGKTGAFYPSIDHIKAFANGGSHTWDNVQLAHIICNSYKRDLITV